MDCKRPEVSTLSGKVRGRRKHTEWGTPYYSFLGIPYAAPPLGHQRFKAPLPPRPWQGVRDASRPGSSSCQPFVPPPIGPKSYSWTDLVAFFKTIPHLIKTAISLLTTSEDCLYANVFTPELPLQGARTTQPPLPVLVLIHSGGFRVGDGLFLYGPDYLMDAGGVVFVTFNYRLGPLGFLSVGTEEAPGNAGLKDQTQLLRWVRDNIAAFGGDPERVTIFGESAGAVSAHLHTLSPLSRGLFHGVVAASGMAAPDWAIEDDPLAPARALALALRVPGAAEADADELARRLRDVSAKHLTRQAGRWFSPFTPRFTLGIVFAPVVEPAHEGAFLAEDPVKVLTEGRQADVPMMVGNSSREGLLIFMGVGDGKLGDKSRRRRRAFMAECMRQSPDVFVPRDLYRGLGEDRAAREEVGAQILQHYFGPQGITLDKFDQIIDLLGDMQFVLPTLRMSRMHAETSSASHYFYYFTHDGNLGTLKDFLRLYRYSGAGHSDILGYMFKSQICPSSFIRPTHRDGKCRTRMLSLLTNFVKTGNPTPPEWVVEHGLAWRPRSSNRAQQLHFLEIADEAAMRSGLLYPRLVFWNELYMKHLGLNLF